MRDLLDNKIDEIKALREAEEKLEGELKKAISEMGGLGEIDDRRTAHKAAFEADHGFISQEDYDELEDLLLRRVEFFLGELYTAGIDIRIYQGALPAKMWKEEWDTAPTGQEWSLAPLVPH